MIKMEYFDILTEDGDRTGMQETRNEVHRDGAWHGSVHIWIIENGQVLLQKRSKNKDLYPGRFDAACTGHIDIYESPLEAAQRELFEELSLKIKAQDLKLLFVQKTHAKEKNFVSNEVNYVYRLTCQANRSELKYNHEEIDKLIWLDCDELQKQLLKQNNVYCFGYEEYERVLNDDTPNSIRTNFHTHTYRCKHAEGTEEEYVQEAIEKGVNILGFSDHAPFMHNDYGYRMGYTELERYLSELDRLILKYSGQIRILKGLEIEYLDSKNDYYYNLLTKHGLDYLALGEHFFESEYGEENIFNDGADSTVLVRYAQAIERALKTGYFSFVAHPDIMFIRNFKWDDNSEQACDIIINAAQKYNTILEFNANGIRRGKSNFYDGVRYPYPHKAFWEKVSKANVRVLVGADCHSPSQIYDACMERAVLYADTMGLNTIKSL